MVQKTEASGIREITRRQKDEAVTRRSFLEKALIGAGAVSTGAIMGAAGRVLISDSSDSRGLVVTPGGSTGDHTDHNSGGTSSPPPSNQQTMTADEMDEHHKHGIDLFIENQTNPITKGKGGLPLEPTIENGVKVFRLTCDEFDWEVAPGDIKKARGYNGAVPGPILRATEGERVRIIVTNNMSESTSIHWHGLFVPNDQDGVTFINQPPIKPGTTYTYEFTLRNSGTHMYHSHHNSMEQVNRGLLGAFIVDPADPSSYPAHDKEFVMVLNDLNLGFTINGKGFPATDALVVKKGERVVIRYLNEGVMNHPMHLHGMPQLVFARDGWPVNPPYMCDTIDVAPGNRYDVLVEATEVGVWAFHCHVLTHAESAEGMFGLVTVMIVEE